MITPNVCNWGCCFNQKCSKTYIIHVVVFTKRNDLALVPGHLNQWFWHDFDSKFILFEGFRGSKMQKISPRTMGTIYTKEGWSIRYNVFWAFQVCSKTFYDFKMIFLQKNFFEVFEVEGWGRGQDLRSNLTLQPKMGYRWNRLDLRNSKILTEKSGTGSVRF